MTAITRTHHLTALFTTLALLATPLAAQPALAAGTAYPTSLVNGSFDYLPQGGWNTVSPDTTPVPGSYDLKYTSIDPINGQYIKNAQGRWNTSTDRQDAISSWVDWNGFDASKFGWTSDQKGGAPQGGQKDHASAVELQCDSMTGNTYAEIVGSEIGKSILQKIDTDHPTDTVYTIRFKHAALSNEHADSMQALVNGQPVTVTRVASNQAGDPTGWTGTDITTHNANPNRSTHGGQWATYEGKVTIPAHTPVSTFSFKALNSVDPSKGNLIDDLSFTEAYPLAYNTNGAQSGVTPRQK